MSKITKEMEAWLGTNRNTYEMYMLHAMMHDGNRASRLLNVPLTADDFSSDETATLFSAIRVAHTLALTTAVPVSFPPDVLEMLDAVRMVSDMDIVEQTAIDKVMRMLPSMIDRDKLASRWDIIDPYFEAWLTGARTKAYARQAQMRKVPDAERMVALMQADMAAARQAVAPVVDDMAEIFDGVDEEQVRRRSTGITALDDALGGGWGENECYVLFSGTGGGKSVCAGQVAWNEANTNGYPLIISTELRPYEYVGRIMACSCTIPINLLKDCKNFKQIRMAVAQDPTLHNRLSRLETSFEVIKTRLRVHKVRPDDSMNALTLLDAHADQYAKAVGHEPTLVILDWLGTLADSVPSGASSAERARDWEMAANGCVAFADRRGPSTLVLAQGTNDCQIHRVLTQQQIGVGKGILKNMVAGIGLTNFVDKKAVIAAAEGKADLPMMTPNEQLLCVVKARKGEGGVVHITREFRYQRFGFPPPRK